MRAILDYLTQVDLRKLVGGSFVILALGLLVLFINSTQDIRRRQHLELLSEGRPAIAQVTGKTFTTDRGGDHYFLEYQYSVGDQTYSARTDVEVDRARYDGAEGTPINIVYLPDDPSVASNDPRGWLRGQAVRGVFGWCFVGVGVVGLLVAGVVSRKSLAP